MVIVLNSKKHKINVNFFFRSTITISTVVCNQYSAYEKHIWREADKEPDKGTMYIVDWGYRLFSGGQRGKLDLLTLDKALRYMPKPMPYLTKQRWGLKPYLTTLNLLYSLKNNEHGTNCM